MGAHGQMKCNVASSWLATTPNVSKRHNGVRKQMKALHSSTVISNFNQKLIAVPTSVQNESIRNFIRMTMGGKVTTWQLERATS